MGAKVFLKNELNLCLMCHSLLSLRFVIILNEIFFCSSTILKKLVLTFFQYRGNIYASPAVFSSVKFSRVFLNCFKPKNYRF